MFNQYQFSFFFNEKISPKVSNVLNNSSRIAGGTTAVPNEYPWMAYLEAFDSFSSNSNGYVCAGTLINDQWILTQLPIA